MGLTTESQVGKKHTIYLPKTVVEEAGLREGMKILITVDGDRIIIEPLQDPVTLAVSGKKFAATTIEEMESTSLKEQSKYAEGPS